MTRFADIAREAGAWAHALETVQIPVLRRTAGELARLRENEENVVARDIAQVLFHDPMFTLRVLRYLQAHRRAAQNADITTIEHAVMMLGIRPFFEHFADMPVVESTLESQPLALEGLMHVAYRAHHAAMYAHDWAALRHDQRVDEVAIAALLHDLAEIMVWCFAPEMSLRMAALIRSEPGIRSGTAQQKVLGFNLAELQRVLIAQWRLAPLLRSLMDDTHAKNPRVMNVVLAVNLARHSALGWDNPALPDDFAAIQDLLKLPPAETVARIQRTAFQAQSVCDWYRLNGVAIPADFGTRFLGPQDPSKRDDSLRMARNAGRAALDS